MYDNKYNLNISNICSNIKLVSNMFEFDKEIFTFIFTNNICVSIQNLLEIFYESILISHRNFLQSKNNKLIPFCSIKNKIYYNKHEKYKKRNINENSSEINTNNKRIKMEVL